MLPPFTVETPRGIQKNRRAGKFGTHTRAGGGGGGGGGGGKNPFLLFADIVQRTCSTKSEFTLREFSVFFNREGGHTSARVSSLKNTCVVWRES